MKWWRAWNSLGAVLPWPSNGIRRIVSRRTSRIHGCLRRSGGRRRRRYPESISAVPTPRMTLEQYFAADDASDRPLEYHDGEVFPIAMTTVEHGIIQANLIRWAGNRLAGTPCATIGT